MIPQEKREAVKGLLEYMPFLVNTKYEDIVSWKSESDGENFVPVSSPDYSDEFLDFIGYTLANNLLDPYYMNTITQAAGGEVDFAEFVEALDAAKYEVAIACLTYLIARESYDRGALAAAFKNRWLYMILYRIKQIYDRG